MIGDGEGSVRRAGAGDVSVDGAAPGPGLGAAAALDELLEPLGVGLDAVVVDAARRAGLLDQAGGLPVDLDHDARLVVAEPVERDDARLLGVAADSLPGDPLVGVL